MPNLLFLSTLIAAKSKSSGSSSISLIIIVLLFVAVYFFFLRPRTKRMRQQQQQTTNLSVGDEVISAGGILGTVTAIAGDEIVVEVSPGYTLTFWRRAINLRTAVKGAPQSSTVHEDDAEYEDETEATGDEASYEEHDGGAGEDEEAAAGDEAADDEDEGEHHDDQGGTSGGASGVR
jgi:preprotein translocase subunit YajC